MAECHLTRCSESVESLECHPDSVHPVAAKFGSEFRRTKNGVGNDRSSGWAVQRVASKAVRVRG